MGVQAQSEGPTQFPHKMCTCDPLRFVLSEIFAVFAQFLLSRNSSDKITLDGSGIAGSCYLCSISEQSKGGIHALSSQHVDRIDQSIKLYRLVSIAQRTTWISGVPSLSVTFTPEYMKLFFEIWSDDETDEQAIMDAFEQSLRCLFQKHGELGGGASPLVLVEKDQLLNQQIMLDRVHIINHCIPWVLRKIPYSGPATQFRNGSISIGLTAPPGNMCEIPDTLPMSQYRKMLTASLINHTCKRVGYRTNIERYFNLPTNKDKYFLTIFVVNEGQSNESDVKNILILRVGDILTRESAKDTKFSKCETIGSFFGRSLRANEQQPMENPHKSDSIPTEKLVVSNAALTKAAINFDLLNSSPAMQLELEPPSVANSREHDSFIIMYNYSRLISVLRKFAEKVADAQYPPIPDLESIDFSRLDHETEIALVQMLLNWPRVLENTVDFYRKEINIGTQLKFIKELAYRFNAFYTLISVLAQPTSPHEFKLMFTRIYFLRAVRNIFHDFFDLLLIEFDHDESKL